MRKLTLNKHARPHVDPNTPSDEWKLADEGRRASNALADALRGQSFETVLSSSEPKALETAQIIGTRLGKPVRVADDLFEHDRRNVPHMEAREFISLVALFFRDADRLVLGDETADEAYDRFAAAVDRALETQTGDVAIVTHGTVIALFAERRAKQDPFAVWRRMGQPSYIVFEVPEWNVLELRERVG
jgi:broad specificity phosphatase PhoE